MYKKYIKRVLDLVAATFALPFFGVIFICIAPFIYLEDRGSIFYKGLRRGVDGKVFQMYKFRSMKMNAPDIRNSDNSTYNSNTDPRLTHIGGILRKTSLDETAQIINVLKGDMSIVGPRPITIDRPLEEYDEKRKIRLTVRPGITGYAQAYYRNSIDQETKFKYDADYAQNVTFVADLRILFKTVAAVIQRKNIYSQKMDTQETGKR